MTRLLTVACVLVLLSLAGCATTSEHDAVELRVTELESLVDIKDQEIDELRDRVEYLESENSSIETTLSILESRLY